LHIFCKDLWNVNKYQYQYLILTMYINKVKFAEIHLSYQIYRKSVVNMGTKIYNKLPGFLRETDDYRVFRKKLKMFLLLKFFYSVEEFVST
jgi:hypothetical protein